MSQGPIANGKDTLLSANPGTLPQMDGTIAGWMQDMVFTTTVKEVVNFVVQETATDIRFMGVWQPFTAEMLIMKPSVQRSWSWFMVHATPNLQLKTDEVVKYQGTQYRVMQRSDYSSYGYMEYHIILDFSGSGPSK